MIIILHIFYRCKNGGTERLHHKPNALNRWLAIKSRTRSQASACWLGTGCPMSPPRQLHPSVPWAGHGGLHRQRAELGWNKHEEKRTVLPRCLKFCFTLPSPTHHGHEPVAADTLEVCSPELLRAPARTDSGFLLSSCDLQELQQPEHALLPTFPQPFLRRAWHLCLDWSLGCLQGTDSGWSLRVLTEGILQVKSLCKSTFLISPCPPCSASPLSPPAWTTVAASLPPLLPLSTCLATISSTSTWLAEIF